MTHCEALEIRRKLSEVKSGFEVTDDPWELVEKLLDENELLKQKIEEAYIIFPEH